MSNPCYEEIAKEVAICQTTDRCPFDCETITYNFYAKSQKFTPEEIETNRLLYENRVVIRIRADQSVGNTIIRHIPLMSSEQFFCYIWSIIAILSGLSLAGVTNLIIDSILSIHIKPKRQVSVENISTIANNQQIQQNGRWRIQKNSSNNDCISSCFGIPRKQRIPWKRTTTSLYSRNNFSLKNEQK
jgi:hypothetical protein